MYQKPCLNLRNGCRRRCILHIFDWPPITTGLEDEGYNDVGKEMGLRIEETIQFR
jgi:hypothetical protein